LNRTIPLDPDRRQPAFRGAARPDPDGTKPAGFAMEPGHAYELDDGGPTKRNTVRLVVRCYSAIAATILVGSTSFAQAPPPAASNTTVSLNYAYAASLGFGGYSLGGLTAGVYTLPLSDTLQNLPRDGWALKLLLPLQFGIYDFHSSFQGTPISLSQQSIAAVPGLELQIPVTTNFVVKPFAQFGAGYSFGFGGSNPGAGIDLPGARSVAQWRSGDYTFSLGNGIVYVGDSTIGPGFGEDYLSLQVAGEVRHPLGFSIGAWHPDLGVYVADYYYPAPLQFSRFLNSPLRVYNQNEIGMSVGSVEPLKILWLSNPRIGVGFVFGGGLKVWHVNFGFPF
jgi:hypothetical protein